MKKYSIFYSITLIFVLTIVSIILAFLYLIAYDKKNYSEQLNTKYSIYASATLSYINGNIAQEEMQEIVKNYDLDEIEEEPLKSYIIKNADVLDYKKGNFGSSSILLYKNKTYLIVSSKGIVKLFVDDDFQAYRYSIIRIIFGLVLAIVIATYAYTIRKIKPLKLLKKQIDKFAKGNFDIPKKQTGNDEISEVANAFYDSVNHIKKMNHSRQLFLRNIMHELKTPITKGIICAEMIEEGKQKQRIISVFERLEKMINEFASIEQLTSGVGLTNKLEYKKLIDIFDEAVDLSMIERKYMDIYINDDISINVDFKLFSLAIKNILDNGIKYSTDQKIKVMTSEDTIDFYTTGEPLSRPFEHYLEPFTQGENKSKGLGLGLYIVDHIVKAHGLTFSHRYENGKNIFSFIGLQKIM